MEKSLLFPKRDSGFSRTHPKFILTKSESVEILRAESGEWVRGKWVDGDRVSISVEANVQPMRGHELLVLSESDRTKESIKVYCSETLQTIEEVKQEEADIIIWNGKKFRATRTMTYKMGVLDHTKTICVRLPETPQNKAYVPTTTTPVGGFNG